MTELKAYQYRLTPTKGQVRLLEQTLELCRWVYNETLAYRKQVWKNQRLHIELGKTNALLASWRTSHPELKRIHYHVLQDIQKRVHHAWEAFVRRIKRGHKAGFPRFKGRGWYDSFTFRQVGYSLSINGQWINLFNIGRVRMIVHRRIAGTIKTLTIRRTRTGKWYASFVVETHPKTLPPTNRAVGVDVGLQQFATLSTGEVIANPRFFRKDEKALRKAQRRLAKTEQNTPERAKRQKVVAHIHERITNRRKDFAHKLSRRLANEFDVIVFEQLRIAQMIKARRLAKSISDAAWRQLITYTHYKAASAGRMFVEVDPRGTSQRCSRCRSIVKKDLSTRLHRCQTCGLEIDRDHNAALNILAVGLHSLGRNP
ncbi:MAG: transposase [Chloroflexus aggregans]|uniref:Transposase n=1 Tax=Chloroflexus aggregans TaxID=152260 RepID=A0A2J6X2N8_9CHLR|nr:MAG: transposase [Chloroflexus aggregans]